MTQKVLSFSVSKNDTANIKLVNELKKECKRTGQNFSWVILKALSQYVNGKET